MANEKQKITTIRKPYYQAQDGLWALQDAVKATGDLELIELLHTAHNALFKFEEELAKKFLWD